METVDEDKIKSNIENMEYIDQNTSWNLSSSISQQKNKLENIIKKRDIQSRMFEAIKAFNIFSRQFERYRMIAETIEEKNELKTIDFLIVEECYKINDKISKSELDLIIEKLRSLCKSSGYKDSFINDLINQWEIADKKLRVVNDIEYATREEAEFVKQELESINRINTSNVKSEAQKYYELIAGDFKTEQAKEQVKKKEKWLIKYVEELPRKSQKQVFLNINIEHLLLIIFYAIVGVALLRFGRGWLLKLFGISSIALFFGSIVNLFKEAISERKRVNDVAGEYKQQLNEFNRIFVIVDDHIVYRK